MHLQEKLAAAEKSAADGAQAAALQQRIAKLEAQKTGLADSLQAGQTEIAALQVPCWPLGSPRERLSRGLERLCQPPAHWPIRCRVAWQKWQRCSCLNNIT